MFNIIITNYYNNANFDRLIYFVYFVKYKMRNLSMLFHFKIKYILTKYSSS